MKIVKVEHLSKTYKLGSNLVKALDDVTFGIEQGEFCAILGPSGSGKSTLLHLLGGVDVPTSGKVFIKDQDIYGQSERKMCAFRRKHIALIYQFYNLMPILNVEENLVLPLLLDHKKVIREELDELLEVLGLKDRRTHMPNELSGGQQQRVAIGRALISKPSILLADEPTGNLDSQNTEEIMRLFREANERYGQTIMMITHDKEITNVTDGVLTLKDGRIVESTLNR